MDNDERLELRLKIGNELDALIEGGREIAAAAQELARDQRTGCRVPLQHASKTGQRGDVLLLLTAGGFVADYTGPNGRRYEIKVIPTDDKESYAMPRA